MLVWRRALYSHKPWTSRQGAESRLSCFAQPQASLPQEARAGLFGEGHYIRTSLGHRGRGQSRDCHVSRNPKRASPKRQEHPHLLSQNSPCRGDHVVRCVRGAAWLVHMDLASPPRLGVASPPNKTEPCFRNKRAANESWLFKFCWFGATLTFAAGGLG
jgi:hypothetical protein